LLLQGFRVSVWGKFSFFFQVGEKGYLPGFSNGSSLIDSFEVDMMIDVPGLGWERGQPFLDRALVRVGSAN